MARNGGAARSFPGSDGCDPTPYGLIGIIAGSLVRPGTRSGTSVQTSHSLRDLVGVFWSPSAVNTALASSRGSVSTLSVRVEDNEGDRTHPGRTVRQPDRCQVLGGGFVVGDGYKMEDARRRSSRRSSCCHALDA